MITDLLSIEDEVDLMTPAPQSPTMVGAIGIGTTDLVSPEFIPGDFEN